MLMFPKPTRKTKKRKPIARKARFRENSNPLKTYHRFRSHADTQAFAEKARQIRLNRPTEAELAFADILRGLAVEYEREVIKFYANGQRFIIIDYFLPERNIAVEIDGGIHNKQSKYDTQRDLWLAIQGIKTIRFSNSEVLKTPEAVRARIKEALN